MFPCCVYKTALVIRVWSDILPKFTITKKEHILYYKAMVLKYMKLILVLYLLN